MFFKKRKKPKKRVICPIRVILEIIQETLDIDAGMSEFIFLFEGNEHKVGFTSDYNDHDGFFDPLFYLDNQEFSTFEEFKAQALLNGQIFANRFDKIEIIDADDGAVRFPWYTKLEDYVVEEEI